MTSTRLLLGQHKFIPLAISMVDIIWEDLVGKSLDAKIKSLDQINRERSLEMPLKLLRTLKVKLVAKT